MYTYRLRLSSNELGQPISPDKTRETGANAPSREQKKTFAACYTLFRTPDCFTAAS
jgi:hypothetical protein